MQPVSGIKDSFFWTKNCPSKTTVEGKRRQKKCRCAFSLQSRDYFLVLRRKHFLNFVKKVRISPTEWTRSLWFWSPTQDFHQDRRVETTPLSPPPSGIALGRWEWESGGTSPPQLALRPVHAFCQLTGQPERDIEPFGFVLYFIYFIFFWGGGHFMFCTKHPRNPSVQKVLFSCILFCCVLSFMLHKNKQLRKYQPEHFCSVLTNTAISTKEKERQKRGREREREREIERELQHLELVTQVVGEAR